MSILLGIFMLLIGNAYSDVAFAKRVLNEGITDCPSESSPGVIYYNTRNTTENSVFTRNRSNVYRVVINRATFRSGSISHASGEVPDRVYGYSACGGFDNPGDCVQCLINVRAEFEQFAPLAVGARSCLKNGAKVCYLRYENYSF